MKKENYFDFSVHQAFDISNFQLILIDSVRQFQRYLINIEKYIKSIKK